MIFSLIVPVYRNEGSIPHLLGALEELHGRLDAELEAVLVVDGSPDRCLELLRAALPAAPYRSQLVALSRNFGAFEAVRAGLQHASGDAFAVMAADLQEPPELIEEFARRLASGTCDIVVGTRLRRRDPLATRLLSSAFWAIYRRLVQREVPRGGVDIFGGTRQVLDQLTALAERNTALVGLVFWVGFRREEVPYERRRREHGRSAWSLRRRLRYLLDSAFAFSDLPVRLLTLAGVLGILTAAVMTAVVLAARLSGAVGVPGYAATAILITFFGGLNSLGLGIIGEYVWRAFENTKGRPSFIVAHRQSFGPSAG